ncbi:MAG: LPS export ABC transporter permease LptF [Pseudomonadota bacterium]
MKTLELYILRQMLGPFGFFVLVLTGVVWLTQSLRVIDIVVNNGQSVNVFLEFTALLLPVVLSIVLQLGALAATIYTLHRMLSESELVAAFAGGASKLRASRPIAVFGLGCMAVLAVDTLYLMPTAARIRTDRVAEIRGDVVGGLIRDGRFLNPAKGLTVYIREISARGELFGVMVQDARDQNSVVTYTAKRGFVTRQQNNPTLVMFDGQAQRLEPGGRRLSLLQFESFAYDLTRFVDDTSDRTRKPSERFFWELVDPDPEEAKSKRAQGKMIAEGHEQLSSPLYALALPLVATATMLSASFSRHGFGGRVALALLFGAGLRVIGLAAKSATTTEPSLWPTMYAPPILGVALAVYVLSRETLPTGRDAGGGRRDPPEPEAPDPRRQRGAARP